MADVSLERGHGFRPRSITETRFSNSFFGPLRQIEMPGLGTPDAVIPFNPVSTDIFAMVAVIR
jgi:hypothetical protein